MIRMVQSSSTKSAKSYFADTFSRNNYYLDDQELSGSLQGKLANRLGLSGPVTKRIFHALCENKHPDTSLSVTARTSEARTVGYDINFHCPKSVSILHALSRDDHLLSAFRQSADETMRDIETDARTRVRRNGQNEDRDTGELLWADFIHQTARPVKNARPDPHLHAHCFVFNATWDEEEQTFKAGQFRDIKRDMPYYQARFHKRLSDALLRLGYRIRRTANSFEVEGVPQAVIDLFSKRTDEIGRVAKEKGITDAKDLDGLGAKTRGKKQKSLGMAELKAEWRKQIKALNLGEREAANPIRFAVQPSQPLLSPELCVDHALRHVFERASVMDRRRVLAAAFRHGVGDASVPLDAIAQSICADRRIILKPQTGRILCTTQEVLEEERRLVELAQEGIGTMPPLYESPPLLDLEGQQRDAARHVLTSPDRVTIIRGAAGTGKTTLLREAVARIEETGTRVLLVAPSSEASRGVLRSEGFAGADTVAKLLTDERLQATLQNQVLVVDEAGLLGNQDMGRLLRLVKEKQARMILLGDTRQHTSVVRGEPLRLLIEEAGIRTAEVTKIYRQKNPTYRAAVEGLANGDFAAGLEKLEAMGAIREVDPLHPYDALIDDYVDAIKRKKSVLIVSPTHANGEALTKVLRKRLRKEGRIGKKEWKVQCLVNLNLTEAEKVDTRNFVFGQIVQFNQNLPGIQRGSVWTIDAADPDTVMMRDTDGRKQTMPRYRSGLFDLYEQRSLSVSKGDPVRITRNGFDRKKRRLNNGQTLELVAVRKDGSLAVRSASGKATYELDAAFGHLAHGYCTTSHGSQGKTVDEVFISQPEEVLAAMDERQVYVSVSRGRNCCHIYTHDKGWPGSHARPCRDQMGLGPSAV